MADINNVINNVITTLLADESLNKRDKLALTCALAVAPMVDGLLVVARETIKQLPDDVREERRIVRAERELRLRQLEREIGRLDEEERKERKEREREEREALRAELRAEIRAEEKQKAKRAAR